MRVIPALILTMSLCAAGLRAQADIPLDAAGAFAPATPEQARRLPDRVSHVNGRAWTDAHLAALAEKTRLIDVLDLQGNEQVTAAALLEVAYALPQCRMFLHGCGQFWPADMKALYAAGTWPMWNVVTLTDATVVTVEDYSLKARFPGAVPEPGSVQFAVCSPPVLHEDGRYTVAEMKGLVRVDRVGKLVELSIVYTLNDAEFAPGDVLVHPLWHRGRFLSWTCAGDQGDLWRYSSPGYRQEEAAEDQPDDRGEPRDPGYVEVPPHYDNEAWDSSGCQTWSPSVEVVVLGTSPWGADWYWQARSKHWLASLSAEVLAPFLHGSSYQHIDMKGMSHADSARELSYLPAETTCLRVRNVTTEELALALESMHTLHSLDLEGCTLDLACAKLIRDQYHLWDLNLRGAHVPAEATDLLTTRTYASLDLRHDAEGAGPELNSYMLSARSLSFCRTLRLAGNRQVTDEVLSVLESWGDNQMEDLDLSGCTAITGSFIQQELSVGPFRLQLNGCTSLAPENLALLHKWRQARIAEWGLADLPFTAQQWAVALPLTDAETGETLEYPRLDLSGAKLDAATLAHFSKLRANSIALYRCKGLKTETLAAFASPVKWEGNEGKVALAFSTFPQLNKRLELDSESTVPDKADWVRAVGLYNGSALPSGMHQLELENCDFGLCYHHVTRGDAAVLHIGDAQLDHLSQDRLRKVWLHALEHTRARVELVVTPGAFLPTYGPVSIWWQQGMDDLVAAQAAWIAARDKKEAMRATYRELEEPNDEQKDAVSKLEREAEQQQVIRDSAMEVLRDGNCGESAALRKLLASTLLGLCKIMDTAFCAWYAAPDDEASETTALDAWREVIDYFIFMEGVVTPSAIEWAPDRESVMGDLGEMNSLLQALGAEYNRRVDEGRVVAFDLNPLVERVLYYVGVQLERWDPAFFPVDQPIDSVREGWSVQPEHLHSTSTMTLRLTSGTVAAQLRHLQWLRDMPTGLDASACAGFDDACVEALGGYSRLRRVNLAGTAVTLKAVRSLLVKGTVRMLDITGCAGVSDKEREALRMVFADVDIKG